MTTRDDSSTPFLAQIGRDIRRRRRATGLTVQQLADRADVSRRLLTDIELGRVNSSLATVDRIATALGVDFPTLVALERGSTDPIVVAEHPVDVWSSELGSRVVLHITGSASRSPELWEWRLVPGDSYVSDADPPGFEELFIVTSGSLLMTTDEHQTVLKTGRAARLSSDRACTLAATGDQPAVALSMLIPAPARS